MTDLRKNPRKFQHYDVAFDKDGNLMETYWEPPDPSKPPPSWTTGPKGLKYEPNCIFSDTFEFVRCYPTKGSAHFLFRSLNTGRKYSMFLSDFEDVMKGKRLIDGHKLQGEFTFCKRGISQGVRMIIEDQDP